MDAKVGATLQGYLRSVTLAGRVAPAVRYLKVSLNDSANHMDPDLSVSDDLLWRRRARNTSSRRD